MLPKILKPRFFDALSNMTGRYIKPEPYHKATGLVSQVYKQVEQEFFINGPMTTHAVDPELLAGVWMAEREILLTDDNFTREEKEALGVTFSQVNGCSYCEDLINSVVYGAKEHDMAETIRYHKQNEIKDEKTRRLHLWALNSYSQNDDILFNPPFTYEEAAEMLGTAFMVNYFNRYVKVFFSGTPLKAPFKSKTIKSLLYKLTGIELRDSVTRRLEPGRSINFLKPANLPSDLVWASGSPTISAAVSRWAAAVEKAGRKHIPENIIKFLASEIDAWQGESMGLSRSWLKQKTESLCPEDAAIAQLALLTALSPAQMSDDIVDTYKTYFNDDVSLIVTVAWSAFMASKRVAGLLSDKSGYFDKQSLSKTA